MVDGNSNKTFEPKLLAEVLSNSYSPFSNFKVASCVESESGNFYYGCNVENSTYGATICAERTAIVKMVSVEGPRAKIKKVFVLSETDEPIPPCGICRQNIYEFAIDGVDLDVQSFSKDFKTDRTYKMSHIFPEGFRL